MRTTKAIIHLDNLVNNINEIKKTLSENTKICIPVKANGYGHGAIEIAKTALIHGVYCLAVATVSEGIELRKANIHCPILLLSLPYDEEIESVVENDLSPLVFDINFIQKLSSTAKKQNKQIKVHIKVDTGMGRIGCLPSKVLEIAQLIQETGNLQIDGICTHLCVSDSQSQTDIDFTHLQIKLFTEAVNTLKQNNINPGIVHCAASGGVLFYKEAHFDMVRPGILVYGYYPDSTSEQVLISSKKPYPLLKPLMELETRIEAIKKVTKGTSISYGRTWVAPKDCYIATIPIGYADGLFRRFSPDLTVTINNQKYPVVGRICMDQCMINLGQNSNIKLWDKVTIFGPNNNCNTAQTLATQINTIPYEITCSISQRVPREFV